MYLNVFERTAILWYLYTGGIAYIIHRAVSKIYLPRDLLDPFVYRTHLLQYYTLFSRQTHRTTIYTPVAFMCVYKPRGFAHI